MFSGEGFSIHAFREGDQRAFNFIFSTYYASICFFANRLIDERAVAEDVAQEAFVRLWEKHDAFHCQQSIKAFLFIITKNACLNFIKRWQRHKKNVLSWGFTFDETEDHALNLLSRRELVREVLDAVEMLPPECRKVVQLSYVQGLRNPEIARQLNLSVHTVKNQKVRGVYLLKKRFRCSGRYEVA